LHETTRAHGRPDSADRREAHDVVLDDHVGPNLVEDLAEPVVDVARAVAERAPGRLDELRELVDRGFAEHGRGLADESFQNWPGSPRPRAPGRAA
jgi:hypothetical protein